MRNNKPVNEAAGADFGIGPHWWAVAEPVTVAIPFDGDCLASVLFGDTLPDRLDVLIQGGLTNFERFEYLGLS